MKPSEDEPDETRMNEIGLMARLLSEIGVSEYGIRRQCEEAAGRPIDRKTVTNWLKHTGRKQ